MARFKCHQDPVCLLAQKLGRKPDVGVKRLDLTVVTRMLVAMISVHRTALYPFPLVNDRQLRRQFAKPCQPVAFKGNPDGKIQVCLHHFSELARARLVGDGALAWRHHNQGANLRACDALDQAPLRRNAHGHGQLRPSERWPCGQQRENPIRPEYGCCPPCKIAHRLRHRYCRQTRHPTAKGPRSC